MKRRCGKVIFKMRNKTTGEVFAYVVGKKGAWWRYEDGSDGVQMSRNYNLCTSFTDYMSKHPGNRHIYNEEV